MATIEIRIRGLAQLFESLDPSPFRQRALGRGAESYILAGVRKHPIDEPLRLLVHLPESLRAHVADVTEGIHEHFCVAHAQGERRFRRRIRTGGITLGVGLAVLSFIAAYFVEVRALVSVWCFFAAILSLLVYLHLRYRTLGGFPDEASSSLAGNHAAGSEAP